MDEKLLYTFRGWIGFVAFMDLSTAVRSFIEKRRFIGDIIDTSVHSFPSEDDILPRVLGTFFALKALALIHCTLFIHYKPVVCMGICSIFVTLLMYGSEVLYYKSTAWNFYVVFPCILNGITMIALIILPDRLLEPTIVVEEENAELLRQATVFKRKRVKKD